MLDSLPPQSATPSAALSRLSSIRPDTARSPPTPASTCTVCWPPTPRPASDCHRRDVDRRARRRGCPVIDTMRRHSPAQCGSVRMNFGGNGLPRPPTPTPTSRPQGRMETRTDDVGLRSVGRGHWRRSVANKREQGRRSVTWGLESDHFHGLHILPRHERSDSGSHIPRQIGKAIVRRSKKYFSF
jgi:hypothetical protein